MRCRAGVHRADPHALDLAADDPAAGAAGRAGVPDRAVRAVGPGAGTGWRRSSGSRCSTGCICRAATCSARAPPTTAPPAAPSPCARRCGPTRSGPRSPGWSASRAPWCWCSGLDCIDGTPLARPQARPLPVHAARPAAGGGFRDGGRRVSAARGMDTERHGLEVRCQPFDSVGIRDACVPVIASLA